MCIAGLAYNRLVASGPIAALISDTRRQLTVSMVTLNGGDGRFALNFLSDALWNRHRSD